MTSELNYQLLISTSILCLNLITLVTSHRDYTNQDFTKLKHSVALSPKIRSSQSHFDLHIDFTSIWLCPKIFHYWIKNLDSLTSKHSKLLANHHNDLRSKGHLYPYPLWAAFDSRALCSLITFSEMYSYTFFACHTSVSTLLDYKNNQLIWHTMINIC